MQYFLHIRHKGGGEQKIPLNKPLLMIGRLETSDVVLPDSNVSRTHAKIHVDQERIEIEDLGSKNFTFVNGEAVKRHRLREGDVVSIGESTLCVEPQTSDVEIALTLSAENWDITDRMNPEGMTLLSPTAYLEKDKQSIQSDLGRLVQIYRFSQKINETIRDYSHLIEEIARTTNTMFHADQCVVGFVSGSGDAMQTYGFPSEEEGEHALKRSLLPQDVLTQVEKEAKSFLIRFAPNQDEASADHKESHSIMCAPLLSQGEKIGYFYLVRHHRKGDFTRWDLEYLTAVANLAGVAIANARQYRHAVEENKRYKGVLQSEIEFVGKSPSVQEVNRFVQKVAASQASVLITGESGTGKELVARAIHAFSPRRMYRFVPINCAAIPDNLLESELFGVEKGAYTDAMEKPGRIELAHQGTLFLDEISDMNPSLQAKLLRVLQQREFERLGGIETRSVDVRIIAATNRDIAKEVQEGRFREDLLYRIQVLRVSLPPLRERKEDIPLLTEHFLARFAEKNGTCVKNHANETMGLLINHDWPGNVRELENAMESALVLSNDWILWPQDFPVEILERSTSPRSSAYPSLQDLERDHILKTLRLCSGNKRKTSRMLGITRQTLDNKLSRYGVKNSG